MTQGTETTQAGQLMREPSRPPPSLLASRGLWLGGALLLVALNLRLSTSSVPPIVDDVRTGLGLSNAAVGAVTTLPVLCFGVAAFGAPALARRWGDEAVIMGCLALIAAGTAIRLVPEVGPFFGGTVILGGGIAVINVLVPSVVKRRFARPGAITGLYITVIMGGGGLATALSVPLRDALGGWEAALAVWALPAALALVAWAPALRGAHRESELTAVPVRVSRDREAWLLSGFFVCQTLLGYAIVAWVPEILQDAGLGPRTAGFMAAIFFVFGIPTAVVVPILAARTARPRLLVVATVVPWVVGLTGLLVAPATGTVVWMALLGLGQGGGFALPLALIVLRSRDGAHAAALSSMVQGVGYVLGAASPPAIGLLRDVTGAWTVALVVLLLLSAAQLAVGLAVTSASRASPRRPGSQRR